jgi:ABC-2 type transport system ATP-binding protein
MRVIEAEGLEKTFTTRVKPEGFGASLRSLVRPEVREVRAVKGVSFAVEAGEVLAFLGPNGAGKSTTIKMLTGILTPSGGRARVLGLDPARERLELSRYIGAVFGQRSQLWFHLPPADSFRLLGAIYEIDEADRKWRQAELVERFGLAPYMDVPVRKLSLGERIRCEIAASLLPAPQVLFLDEPTIGLDVIAKREIRLLLTEAAEVDGVTVFLTSHDIGDIEKICKRAIIIHHGEVVVDESMKDLRHRALAKKLIGVKYAEPVRFEIDGLSPTKTKAAGGDGAWTAASFEVDTRRHSLPDVIRALVQKGEVLDLTVEDEALENIIAGIYGARTGAEAAAAARPGGTADNSAGGTSGTPAGGTSGTTSGATAGTTAGAVPRQEALA